MVYNFHHAVAAFMASQNIDETKARLAAWMAGPIKGEQVAIWYSENRHMLSNTDVTVRANEIWTSANEVSE